MIKKVKQQKKEMVRTPKGMHDLLPTDVAYYEKIYEKARLISEFYGFSPIETPHVENTDLFIRPLGEATDVVEKEMYSFKSKGGDMLTLRPEGTAPVMRAYYEHGMQSWPQPVKLYYNGSFFRHERPQRGRTREFRQFGAEIIGEQDPIIDAILIKIAYLILKEIGFPNVLIHINSLGDRDCRGQYKKELLAFSKKKFNYLCKDCKRRVKDNPLRLLDCKDTACVEIRAQAPQPIAYLCNNCKAHLKGVLEYLDEGEIPYTIDHHLVRGFDYYGRTVFEIFLEEDEAGALEEVKEGENKIVSAVQLAVGGGGRYDELMTLLGGKSVPAAGFAFGLERIVHEMKAHEIATSKIKQSPKVFLVQIGAAAKRRSFKLVEELRKGGVSVGESLSRDNLRSQLSIAAKLGAHFSLILGQKEAMGDTIIVRNMIEGSQETVMQKNLIDFLKNQSKKKK
jgi:histidyl-tRNA synthetase